MCTCDVKIMTVIDPVARVVLVLVRLLLNGKIFSSDIFSDEKGFLYIEISGYFVLFCYKKIFFLYS